MDRIAGGVESIKNSWPWMALLNFGFKRCGGTLLNDVTILTAAHCCFGFDLRPQDVTGNVFDDLSFFGTFLLHFFSIFVIIIFVTVHDPKLSHFFSFLFYYSTFWVNFPKLPPVFEVFFFEKG